MKCKKQKICSACEATFKMERGCLLEKRCKACRFLGISTPKEEAKFRMNSKSLGYVKDDFDHTSRYILHRECEDAISHYYEAERFYLESKNVDIPLQEELQLMIYKTLGHINDKERDVISWLSGLRDGDTMTQAEVGIKLGLSRERIRQIELSAIKKLKHPKIGRPLKNYLHYGYFSHRQ